MLIQATKPQISPFSTRPSPQATLTSPLPLHGPTTVASLGNVSCPAIQQNHCPCRRSLRAWLLTYRGLSSSPSCREAPLRALHLDHHDILVRPGPVLSKWRAPSPSLRCRPHSHTAGLCRVLRAHTLANPAKARQPLPLVPRKTEQNTITTKLSVNTKWRFVLNKHAAQHQTTTRTIQALLLRQGGQAAALMIIRENKQHGTEPNRTSITFTICIPPRVEARKNRPHQWALPRSTGLHRWSRDALATALR